MRIMSNITVVSCPSDGIASKHHHNSLLPWQLADFVSNIEGEANCYAFASTLTLR